MRWLRQALRRCVHWYLFRYSPGDRVRWLRGEAPYTIRTARYIVQADRPACVEYHLWRDDRMVAWVEERDLEPWVDVLP